MATKKDRGKQTDQLRDGTAGARVSSHLERLCPRTRCDATRNAGSTPVWML
jgi:hypothetical protein